MHARKAEAVAEKGVIYRGRAEGPWGRAAGFFAWKEWG